MRKYIKILNEWGPSTGNPAYVANVQNWFHKIGEVLASAVSTGELDEPVEFRDDDVASEEDGHWVATLSFRFVPDNAASYNGRHRKDDSNPHPDGNFDLDA